MSRALIVANKTWEADPLVEFLMSFTGTQITAPVKFQAAADREPRYLRGRLSDANNSIEILCLQDALAPGDASSSEAKAKALPKLLTGDDVRIVIAFGTAATFGETSYNGSVVVGTNVFVHDPQSSDTGSHWVIPPGIADTVTASALGDADFTRLFRNAADAGTIAQNLLAPPFNPSPRGLLADYAKIAVSAVNITHYSDYKWSDPDTVGAFFRRNPKLDIGSLETTHGVIRACTTVPFAFVSGIVDRIGHFNDEVNDAQNFVGARNAGVAIACFAARLLSWLGS